MADGERKGVAEIIVEALQNGADIETVIRLMRNSGLNQPDSITLLTECTGVDLGDAQSAVLESTAWADQRERNIQIQDELAQALSELSQESRGGFRIILDEDDSTSSQK
jgi:hypothetical protein